MRSVRSADYNLDMYDALTSTYAFSCPRRGDAHVSLSAFRQLERLPGAAHPAVYSVRFACVCGDEHVGLVSHDDLDWAPLGAEAGTFLNLMTARVEQVGAELAGLAASHIRAGKWPWSFFCYPEGRPRPVFPSSFLLLSPGGRSLGLAVRCPGCGAVSVNLVTPAHVDVPFWNDARVGVVSHVFGADVLRTLEEFRDELYSSRFDERRLDLR